MSEETRFSQEARIKSVTGWSHIRSIIEDFCANRFCANAQRGRLALEHAIEKLYAETKEQVLDKLHFFEHSAPSTVSEATD